MTYPLAHDDDGMPVKVPPMAAGWLVRRWAGGVTRLAPLYDDDGRPLVVALDATAADLRALGCEPGPYRLDAVDSLGKALGVSAYTRVGGAASGADEVADEVADEIADEIADPSAVVDDGAVVALARTIEAMQRADGERQRARSLTIDNLIVGGVLPVMHAMAQVLDRLLGPRPADASPVLAPPSSDGRDAEDLDGRAAEISRMGEIFQALTPEERAQAKIVMAQMTDEAMAIVMRQLRALPLDEAIRQLRDGLCTAPAGRRGSSGGAAGATEPSADPPGSTGSRDGGAS